MRLIKEDFNQIEAIQGMLKSLERPSKTLTSGELVFLNRITDLFNDNRALSTIHFNLLKEIYAQKGNDV